jgi:hypothetical protein
MSNTPKIEMSEETRRAFFTLLAVYPTSKINASKKYTEGEDLNHTMYEHNKSTGEVSIKKNTPKGQFLDAYA